MAKQPPTIETSLNESPIAAIYSKWLPIYVGQAKLDDEKAEPSQKPLIELEKASDSEPALSMQDFFHQLAIRTCLGNMCSDFTDQQRDEIFAFAMAEAKEREGILSLIEQHMRIFDATQSFAEEIGGTAAGNPEFDALCDKELELLNALVNFPSSSIDNIVLKGRHLAALQKCGGLSHDLAEDFVRTFADVGRESA